MKRSWKRKVIFLFPSVCFSVVAVTLQQITISAEHRLLFLTSLGNVK